MALVYLVLLLFLSGLLQALLPEGWPAPDLFLVYALWLAASRPPLLGLALGFLARFLPQGLQGLLGPLEELVPLSTAFLLFLLTYALLRGSGGLRTLPPLAAGAGVATLLFEGIRLGLPRLLPRSQYELLYGPLAGFVLALLGLYLILLALLVGAVAARVLEEAREAG